MEAQSPGLGGGFAQSGLRPEWVPAGGPSCPGAGVCEVGPGGRGPCLAAFLALPPSALGVGDERWL